MCTRLDAYASLERGASNDSWDQLKTALRVTSLWEARAAHQVKVAGRRRQVQRLRASLRVDLETTGSTNTSVSLQIGNKIDSLADCLGRMSLDPPGRVTLLRNLIAVAESGRREL